MAQRKHAELIKQWADDDSLVIEKLYDGAWVESNLPFADDKGEYRIKPTKPSIDWSAHVFNYMATSSTGVTFMYEKEPIKDEVMKVWLADGCAAPAKWLTSFKAGACDWKDSLVKRPEAEQ